MLLRRLCGYLDKRLGALALLALLTFAAPAQAQSITTGHLDWGVKASFRSYVEGSIGHGTITVSGGATKNADGTFRFPVTAGTFTAEGNATDVKLGGTVRFSAHEGALDLTIRDPRVVIARGGSKLIADVTSKPLSGSDSVVFDDVTLTDLDISDVAPATASGQTTWAAVPTILTSAGAPAFAGFYQPGTGLDPATLRYTGPGGKPDLTEEFAAPGTPRYGQTGTPQDVYSDTFFFDPARGVVHTIAPAKVTAVDAETVAVRGSLDLTGVTAYTYDPETATIYLAGAAGRPLRTLTWDGSAYEIATIEGSVSYTRTHLAYDATKDKLYVVEGLASGNFTNTGTPVSPKAAVITRAGAVTEYPALDTGGRAVSGLAVSLQGRIVATQHAVVTGTPGPATIEASPAVQLIDTGTALTVTTIANTVPPKPTGSFTFGYASPTPGPGSNVTLVEAGVTGGSVLALDTTATGFVGTTRIPLDGTVLDVAVDPIDGLTYAAVNPGKAVVIRDGAIAGTITTPPTGVTELEPNALGARGGVLYFRNNLAPVKLFAYKLTATSPTVIAPPENATRTLLEGETSKSVAFQAGAIGDPAPTVQWQVRNGASAPWRDIPGATATALAQTVTLDDDGHQYRAIFENAGGRIATAPATLEVLAAPSVLVQPSGATAITGRSAVLKVGPGGNPYPDIQWQRRDDGFWEDIPGATASFLTIEDANLAMSGATFRARLRNSIDTVYSRAVGLTVTDPPPDIARVAAGALDWGLKESFRRYIVGPIAHGAIAVRDGATINADGTFRFPLAGGEYERTRRTGEFRARGTVHFSGHNGLLDMTLTSPRVVVDGETATLYANVKSKSLNTGAVEDFPNVRFATLTGGAPADLTAPAVFGPLPAVLTDPGAPAFAGFYAAGSVLDPLSFTVTAWVPEGETPPVEEEEPPPAATPTPTPVGAVPTPAPTPTVTPAAVVRKPAVKRVAARQAIARTGVVRLASLTCGSAACTVSRPKTVTVRIKGRSYRATVSGPTRLAAGRTGELRLRLPKAAVRALGSRRVSAKVTVTVTAGGQRVKQTISTSFKLKKG